MYPNGNSSIQATPPAARSFVASVSPDENDAASNGTARPASVAYTSDGPDKWRLSTRNARTAIGGAAWSRAAWSIASTSSEPPANRADGAFARQRSTMRASWRGTAGPTEASGGGAGRQRRPRPPGPASLPQGRRPRCAPLADRTQGSECP